MRALTLLALTLLPAAAFAQKNAVIPDTDPEAERRTFLVADGFEVSLFAGDPMLAKPVQMNFDPQGRLWVVCSEIYPQIKPGETANDKVLILEDTNGDGTADKTTVFADGLLIPTGVEPGDGGAYVADSTDLVHFSDPDPKTGKARKKRVVLSGFGTEDTHHIVHTFRWGPDALLYFNQSVYIHSHVETPHGVRRLNAGGIWRFRPETSKLDVFARGWWNAWGTHWDRWGATFATDGAGTQGINYVVPGAYYEACQGSDRVLPGLNPGSPKFSGLEVLSGRHLPDDWQGNLVTNDFRGHRVCRFVVQPDGAGFASREKAELVKTTHPAFRPIDVKMGPDGAIYIADWYNPIIQHGEVDFRDPRRDKTHGRIWRVTAKGRPLVERPKLAGATVPDLLDQLKAPEQWTRTQAKRVLKERGAKDVLPELAAWASKLDPAADHDRLEALWLYQAFDTPEPKLLDTVLNAKEPNARATACRVAGMWADRLPDAVDLLSQRVADDHPRVRLEAVRALTEVGTPAAATFAAKVLDKPLDRWLDYAVWLTLRELAPAWLPELRAGKLDFGGDPGRILFALKAAGTTDVAGPLFALLKGGNLMPDRQAEVMIALARVGGPDELGYVVGNSNALSQEAQGRVLTAVAEEARNRKVGPSKNGESDGTLYSCMDVYPGPARQAACRLAGLWKVEDMRPTLEKIAAGNGMAQAGGGPASAEDRRAACDGLALLGGAASVKYLAKLAGPSQPADVRRTAVVALASTDARSAAESAADALTSAQPGDDHTPLFVAFVERKGGAASLAKALAGRKLPPDVAKVGVRVAKAAGQPDQALVAALTTAGGLTAPKRDWSKAEIDRLASDAAKLGDPARGELMYRRADLACLKCHGIAGAGGVVGPDLTSIGASAQADYIVESLLLPNAKIKEGYHSQVVTTLAGKVVTGIKVRDAAGDTLVLRDAEDREIVIPAADIDEKKDGKSLMPDGTTDPLTQQEFLDLVRFLSAVGKVGGGYAASPGRVVRRWEALQPTKDVYTLANRDRIGAVAKPGANLTWVPVYSLVSGDLPADALPVFEPHEGQPGYAVGRFQLDVTTGGPVKLVLGNPAGLSVWADGTPVDAAKEMTVDLKPGVRTVTVAVRPDARKEPLRVELDEVPGSPARARIVGGK